MKTTDYSKVADVYDKNPYRFEEVRMDVDLDKYIKNNPKLSYKILDLACGTGIYLERQVDFFKATNIHWHGLDASQEMLHKAKEKVEKAAFDHGRAENMPYEDETFDIIINNYAFHHFAEKEKALDEVQRVLKKGGVFKMDNIDSYGMKNWWVYHYFPAALGEDYKRFWGRDLIFSELSERGFAVRIDCNYQMENIEIADYLGHVENRDISVLTLIDDSEYEQGLYRMKQDLASNPEKQITNDFSELFCIARKN
ncbi:class I SAM-dependent methyltransferase [Thalassobacillus sp. B23F22_16]|uniref:class I SAM-dependent methyltransferase n=1 Tax=Thalassobacillus sp. B23F22_16 TaxID=3459513 RepID=UPI00373F8EAD